MRTNGSRWLLLVASLAFFGCSSGGGGSGTSTPATGTLTIAPATLPGASLGAPYAAGLTVSGGAATFSWAATGLPPGITIATSSAVVAGNSLGGTPTQAGVYSVTVGVVDGAGRVGQQQYSLAVTDALTITTATLPEGELNAPYSASLAATGGAGPYTWSVVTPSALPPGVTLQASTGLTTSFTGAPTLAGTYSFTVRLEDAQARSVLRPLALVVRDTFRIFVIADLDIAQQNELYMVVVEEDLSVRAPVKVSGNIIPSGGDVINLTEAFVLSPNKRLIAYVADAEVDGENELFFVDVSGPSPGPARKLNNTFTNPATPQTLNPIWSPDSTKIAWREDGIVENRFDVYFANVTGSTITPIRVDLGTGHSSSGATAQFTYNWSPDSRFLAIRMAPTGSSDVYVVDTATSPFTPVLVSTNRLTSGDVDSLTWLKSGNTLVFVGDLTVANQADIYAVTVTAANLGLVAPSLALTITPTADVSTNSTRGLRNDLSPDGSKLAIRVLATAGDQLFIAPATGGVLGTPLAVTTSGDINGYEWSPDSRRVALNLNVGGQRLWYADVSGALPTSPVPVTASTLSGTNPEGHYGWSPDSRRVIWRNSSINTREGFISDVSSGPAGVAQRYHAPVTVTGSPVGIGGFRFSPDATQIAFLSVQNTLGVTELFLNDVSGAAPLTPTQINPTPVTGGNVIDPTFTPNSRGLLFRGDLLVDGQFRLFLFDIQTGVPQTGIVDVIPNMPSGATGITNYIPLDF